MPSFEVVMAAQKGEIKNSEKWGAKKDIALSLKAADGVVHEAAWWADAAEPIPAAGVTLEGELTPSDYGLKFKPARKGGQGRGGGGKSPEERRSIAMQHAQKCAVDVLALVAQSGVYKPGSVGEATSHAKTVAQALWQQVQDAEANAPGTVKGLPVRNEPVHTGAPDTVTPSADYPEPGSHEPFELQNAEAGG